jgi:hypothetical protein
MGFALGAIASGVIGAVGSVVAAGKQAKAADRATQAQLDMFNKIREDLLPFMGPGVESLNMLMGRLPELTTPFEPTVEQLESTPGYQFALGQGLKSVQNSYAARGLGSSGAAMKGAATFATGLANQTFNDRLQNELEQRRLTYNMLIGPAQLGATAAAGSGQAGAQISPGIAASTIGAGNASAAGIIGATNSVTGAINNAMQYALINRLIGGGGASL